MASDEELVARLVEGDQTAVAELLRRYERPLLGFIHRQTAGRDVEDLYQETWLRVVRHAERFDPGKRFSTWLFQIAVNLCRDWHRRPPPEPSAVEPEADGRNELGRTEAGIDAHRLLGTLSEPQREVVILRFYHDLSEEQVADVLDCPKGTVKSRLHNAIARLTALVRGERT